MYIILPDWLGELYFFVFKSRVLCSREHVEENHSHCPLVHCLAVSHVGLRSAESCELARLFLDFDAAQIVHRLCLFHADKLDSGAKIFF